MRRIAALFALLLAAACAQPPVRDEVTIEFSNESETVQITAETRFETKPRSDEARARVDTARRAAESGTDAWSARFGRVQAESDQVLFHRERGQLDRASRSARIKPDDLQAIFSDVAVTIDVVRGEGWRELRLYPGASARASREQIRRFDDQLASWSQSVTRYINAVHRLYSYLDEQPGRAQFVFAAMLDEKGAAMAEDEQPLLKEVFDAMEDIGKKMEDEDQHAQTMSESADLIFNPLPGRFVVRVPADVLAREGFAEANNQLTIEPVDLVAAVTGLEGKWISPDPLALLVREEQVTSSQLAAKPRHSTAVVHASDVARALRTQLARPKAYVVRWRD